MFEISKNFIGGNIEVKSIGENEAVLRRELRDTEGEWFYWAFCVCGANDRTVTFDICDDYLGSFGPAVSHDNRNWHWLNQRNSDKSFTYTFSDDEDCVYFAHHMLYHPDRFRDFCKKKNIAVKTLDKAKNGDNIPYITFGEGEEYILLTSRHHACESTGSYVLEGVLSALIDNPIAGLKVICVPFMDYDGVCAGDQGKNRIPHDHNRDYEFDKAPIYNTVKFVRDFASSHKIKYAFDFHSPWHRYDINDYVFFAKKNYRQLKAMSRLSALLEKTNEGNTLKYSGKNTIEPDTDWNSSDAPCFGPYMGHMTDSIIAMSVETCYFGKDDSIFTDKGGVELGKNFAKALMEFDKGSCKITIAGDILWHEQLMKNCSANGSNGYREAFFPACETLLNTDFLVGNPETVFSKNDTYTHERYCFNTPENGLKALKKTGFDLLTFANNHVMDRGTDGIKATIDLCRAEGQDYIGICDNESKKDDLYIKNIGGINVAFLNFTYGTNAFAHRNFLKDTEKYMVNLLQPEETTEYAIDLLQDLDKIDADVKRIYIPEREGEKIHLHRMEMLIKKAKEKADFVIVLLHTGGQYNTEPDAFSKLAAKRAKDAGADTVLCNHPHIILPSELENGVFTAYGYGNFHCAPCGECTIDPNYSAALKIALTKTDGKICAGYSFILYKNVVKDGMLKIKNTYDILAENGADKELEKEILFYASRFAGVKTYEKAEKEYFIN